jgi:gamma-glutamylputrescine oxidase
MRSWGEPPWRRVELPTRSLQDSAPEVAIVGGGLTGASAAYHVARSGIRAVLLEAARVGDGASGRTGGIVLEGTARGVLKGVGQCVPQLARLVEDAKLDCDLRLPGCWEIEHRDDADDDGCDDHPGTPSGALPWKDAGVGIRIARTVVGGTVDPMALLCGLVRAAADAGAIVHEHAAVRRIDVAPEPALELDGATIRPRRVIVAVNAWTSALLPDVRHVESALTFALATAPLAPSVIDEIGLGAGFPFYTIDTPYLWGRLMPDGGVIFGSGLAYGRPRELESLDLEAADAAAALARLEARVRKLHPALRKVRVANRWAGPIGIPRGMVPLVGPMPDAPAVLVAGGYAGHGVALSVWMGWMLARAIVEDEALPPWGGVAP